MKKDDDPLNKEISVGAHLTDTGLSIKVKSRAAAAADRLIGSFLDTPIAYVEGFNARIRARNQAQNDLIEADKELAVRQLLSSDQPSRALRQFLVETDRKYENREAVVLESIEALTQSLIIEEEEQDSGDALDDDWLNIFGDYAERASSERLRWLWGRILAGELRKPKSFSLTTLRIVSEIDKEIAELFQSKMQERVTDYLIPKPPESDIQSIKDLAFLAEFGLLHDVTSDWAFPFNSPGDGFHYVKIKNYGLKVAAEDISWPKMSGDQRFKMDVVRITRAGRELSTILPTFDGEIGARIAAERLRSVAKLGFKIQSVTIVAISGDQVEELETLIAKRDEAPD